MKESSIEFLNSNRHHYDLLIKAGYVKHVDHAFKEGLLNVIRTEFDSGYNVNLWCGECVMNMITFAWTQFDKRMNNKTGVETPAGN